MLIVWATGECQECYGTRVRNSCKMARIRCQRGEGAKAEYIYNAKLALVKVEVLPEAGNISVGINALHPTVEELVQARRRCG